MEEARRIAEVEGRKFQTVPDELLTEWVEREKDSTLIEVWLRENVEASYPLVRAGGENADGEQFAFDRDVPLVSFVVPGGAEPGGG